MQLYRAKIIHSSDDVEVETDKKVGFFTTPMSSENKTTGSNSVAEKEKKDPRHVMGGKRPYTGGKKLPASMMRMDDSDNSSSDGSSSSLSSSSLSSSSESEEETKANLPSSQGTPESKKKSSTKKPALEGKKPSIPKKEKDAPLPPVNKTKPLPVQLEKIMKNDKWGGQVIRIVYASEGDAGLDVQREEPTEYTVEKGDSLDMIADENHITVKQLMDANPRMKKFDLDEELVGEVILIPENDLIPFAILKDVADVALMKSYRTLVKKQCEEYKRKFVVDSTVLVGLPCPIVQQLLGMSSVAQHVKSISSMIDEELYSERTKEDRDKFIVKRGIPKANKERNKDEQKNDEKKKKKKKKKKNKNKKGTKRDHNKPLDSTYGRLSNDEENKRRRLGDEDQSGPALMKMAASLWSVASSDDKKDAVNSIREFCSKSFSSWLESVEE